MFFTASDYITIRTVGAGEGIPSGDPDQSIGAQDPHLWTDPVAMKQIVDALAQTMKSELGLDVSANATTLDSQLDTLNQDIINEVATLPTGERKLVTGHESLGYFAQRYGFKLVGAIIPSLNTQAEASAADMSALAKLIKDNQVKAIFTELGTPANVSQSIGTETGVKVIEITTHALPANGDYFDFMHNLAQTIVDGLK
jgi:zinc/manganese transport system substrate-binding protein